MARNEGLYWHYETWLRQQESDRGLPAMASGFLFAVRRSLWKPLDPDVGDDFVLPLRVAIQGYRNVIEHRPYVVAQLTQKQIRSMLGMKMRIVSKDLRGLLANKSVLNPLKTGPVALALLSHKLLHWLVPLFSRRPLGDQPFSAFPSALPAHHGCCNWLSTSPHSSPPSSANAGNGRPSQFPFPSVLSTRLL